MIDGSSLTQVLVLAVPLLVAGLAWYIWCAVALAAVFAKSGEPGWKAWVPVLNLVELLRLGGLSGWWVLLLVLPGVGALVVWIFTIIAAYRISLSFGYSGAMAILAAVLFPVWATIIGFGSARWIGREGRRRSASTTPSGEDDALDILAVFDPPPAAAIQPSYPVASPPPPPPPPPVSPFAPPAAEPAAPEPAAVEPVAPVPGVPEPAAPEPLAPEPLAAPSVPEPLAAEPPAPEPFAPPASAVRPAQTGGTGWVYATDGPDEVTDAVPGAPAPISADRGRFQDGPLFPPVIDDDQWSSPVPPSSTTPPSGASSDEPEEAPATSANPDVFPEGLGETSGAVSAIVGAPVAGSPLRARSAVSAADVADGDFDATLIAHRNRPRWSLIREGGEEIELRAQVVILGRRPSPDPDFAGAQLVSVDDPTVSKTHARLELRGEQWYITDLGSTNGVVVTDAAGTEVELAPSGHAPVDGRFLLGDLELRMTRASR